MIPDINLDLRETQSSPPTGTALRNTPTRVTLQVGKTVWCGFPGSLSALLTQYTDVARCGLSPSARYARWEPCTPANSGLKAVKQVTIQSYSLLIAFSDIKGDLDKWN